MPTALPGPWCMLKAFMLPSALSSLLEQTPETCYKILPVRCAEPVGAPAPQLQTPKPGLRAAVRWLAALGRSGRSALGRGQRMQRRRNIIRCDVCDDEDTTVHIRQQICICRRYNTQANEVAVGPLQARYDGIHRSHTTILGPNVRLGPKVQSSTDRYSLDKAVAAGTSQSGYRVRTLHQRIRHRCGREIDLPGVLPGFGHAAIGPLMRGRHGPTTARHPAR